jgi:hypothetical protein
MENHLLLHYSTPGRKFTRKKKKETQNAERKMQNEKRRTPSLGAQGLPRRSFAFCI